MSHNLWSQFQIRKADYEADETLRKLLADVSRENDEEGGVVTVTEANGTHWVWNDVEDYCMKAGIAFDDKFESDLECSAYYRIYRPGNPEIDAEVVVDNSREPYVPCSDLNNILGNKSLSDADKVRFLQNVTRNRNFPCPLIEDYRSKLEQSN